MSILFSFRQTKPLLVLLVSIFATCFFFVLRVEAQVESPESFCALESPILVSIANTETQTLSNQLANTILLQNISSYHLGGIQVGIGVFSGSELTHIYVAEKNLTLEPGGSHASNIDIDASILPPGSYSYQSAAVQGDVAALISELLTKNNPNRVLFQKEGGSQEQLSTVINGLGPLDRGEAINLEVITTNTSNSPLFKADIEVVLTKGTVPFGTAVLSQITDEAKLFPGSTRKTQLTNNFAQQGTHTVFVVQHIPNTLLPITTGEIAVGTLTGNKYETQVSSIGVNSVSGSKDSIEVVSCLEQFARGEVSNLRIANLPIQITQSGGNSFESDFLFSDTNSTIVSSIPVLTNGVATHIALFDAPDTEEGRIDTVRQEIPLNFDCDRHRDICEDTAVDVAIDFAQTEPVKQSFWFYAGITLAGLLLMLLIIRRMNPQSVSEDEDDEEHSEHELH